MTLRRTNAGKGHTYHIDGVKVDGVTTLLSDGLAKPALISWAANVTCDYVVDHWDELTRDPISERAKKIRKARFAQRDAAAQRGTEVHRLAEQLIWGEEVEIPEEIEPHVRSYVQFLDDWQPRPVLIETVVGSRRWQYAGCFDGVMDLPDGRRVIFDIKTSRSGIFPEVSLQLAGYRYAETYVDSSGEEHPMADLNISSAFAVWIRDDGYTVYEVQADENQHLKFLYVAALARWSKNNKHLISDPLSAPQAVTSA